MNATTRNLAWKLNWYRQSELEGALLLGRMVGTVDDPYLASRLSRHCAEGGRTFAALERGHLGVGIAAHSYLSELSILLSPGEWTPGDVA